MPERSSRRNDGFTLVELTAVLAILTVLMYIAVPGMLSYIKESRRNSRLYRSTGCRRGGSALSER